MLVQNWMSTKVITVDVDDSMQEAIRLLKELKDRNTLLYMVDQRENKREIYQ